MIANLPLLFANGNPSALSKITAAELEKFITFMVTCSWGHDTAKDIRQPPWWPADVTFSHPFVRPADPPKEWEARLKNLVKKCYEYHKSAFLLVFSAQLARYPRNRLRYVDNRDHTTSLYYRPNGRLLVTFRNENIYYDREGPKETTVKPNDILLCDNCDSHFDNPDALKVHERLCNNENIPSSDCGGGLPEFLSALKLQPIGQKTVNSPDDNTEADLKPKSNRNAANIDRGPPYPFSSLAYMRNVKTNGQRDMTYSRERVERYCCTTTPLNKQYNVKGKNQQFPIRYRRPIDYWHRKHVFPNQRNKKILGLTGQLLLLKCRPISVHVDRMSQKSMEDYIEDLRKEAEVKKRLMEEKEVVIVDNLDGEHPDVEMKMLDPLKRADSECEVIDLCSDDESPSVNENCDPRAGMAGVGGVGDVTGVACVMRGGAVLRRTATAAPRALPAPPCGARQRPLPPAAVLQPHPVILIAHTLNHLQTISID